MHVILTVCLDLVPRGKNASESRELKLERLELNDNKHDWEICVSDVS